jgi:hypothetical protein
MIPLLTPGGYAQTKAKLDQLEKRLAELARRNDLTPQHRAAVRRSYQSMMRKYRREIELYEASANRPEGKSKPGTS